MRLKIAYKKRVFMFSKYSFLFSYAFSNIKSIFGSSQLSKAKNSQVQEKSVSTLIVTQEKVLLVLWSTKLHYVADSKRKGKKVFRKHSCKFFFNARIKRYLSTSEYELWPISSDTTNSCYVCL